MIKQIEEKLLMKCLYKCKICPNKCFESEEYLNEHHKRKHPGVMNMHVGDLNY